MVFRVIFYLQFLLSLGCFSQTSNLEISRIYPDSGLCTFNPQSPCITFFDAQNYCDSLNQNGNNDWFLPSLDELMLAASGGASIPDYRTTDYLWTRSLDANQANGLARIQQLNLKYISTVQTVRAVYVDIRGSVRCVRIK